MASTIIPEITKIMVVPKITQVKVDFQKNLTNVTTHMELKKRSVMQRYVFKI